MISKLNVRLPDELRERLTKAALEAQRSLNREIIFRLIKSFDWEQEHLAAKKRKESK